jgi:hypothetical protein
MIKKIGLPLVALAAMLAFVTPKQADARVRFGVAIGGPVYTAPVPYAYPYYGPYNPYYAAPYPGYAAPAYVGPSVGVGIGVGGWGGGYYGGHYGPGYYSGRGYGGGFHGRAGFHRRR